MSDTRWNKQAREHLYRPPSVTSIGSTDSLKELAILQAPWLSGAGGVSASSTINSISSAFTNGDTKTQQVAATVEYSSQVSCSSFDDDVPMYNTPV